MVNSYFEALEMIKKEPAKSYEIMGADVKQTGEEFAKSAAYLRWQDKAANQKFFAGEIQAFSKEAADLLLEVGIIKADARPRRRWSTRSSSSDARRAAGAGRVTAALAHEARSKPRRRRSAPRASLGIAFFVVFFAVWAAATFGGFVSKTFLADPVTMLREGWALFAEHGFATDVGMTVWRVVGGFVLAAVFAVPLGIAMGAYKPIEAFFEPFVSFARYLPASAFIPLLILWAGIGEMQKLLVIFIGSFFQIVLMIAVIVGAHAARPGRGRLHARRVVDAASCAACCCRAPRRQIAETLRLVLGWAWTYVIVAELIGASSGIGHMITDSQALLNTGQIIFGIIVIGVIGLVSDFLFKWANQRLFSVEPRVSATRMSALRHRGRQPHVSRRARRRADRRRCSRPTLTVADNDFITILGPSGCGKSTLLRIVAGPRHADHRPRAARRRAGHRAGRRPRHGVPVLHAVPVAHRAREHLLRAAREGDAAAAAGRDRRALHRAGRPRRLRAPLSEDALRRHAAAHGDRARARQRSEDPAARRAVRRARQPDARPDAGAAARHLGGGAARPCCSSPTTSRRRSSWRTASS